MAKAVLVLIGTRKLMLAPHVAYELKNKSILENTERDGVMNCLKVDDFWKALRSRV